MNYDKLSYNDASLPYGGFFDEDTHTVKEGDIKKQFDLADGSYRCHMSHRQGGGIDINRGRLASNLGTKDASGTFVYDTVTPSVQFGPQTTKKDLLILVAESLFGKEVREPYSLHFQFDQ